MAIVRVKDMRLLDDDALQKRFGELEKEFIMDLTQLRTGGRAPNPGKIKEMRRSLSKIRTIMRERELGINVHGASLSANAAKAANIAKAANVKAVKETKEVKEAKPVGGTAPKTSGSAEVKNKDA